MSLTRLIQSTPSQHTILRFILMLSSHLWLGLPSGLFTFIFPPKRYAFLVSHVVSTEKRRPALQPNHPPIQWLLGYFPGVKAAVAWSYHPLRLTPRLRVNGSVLLLALCAFICVTSLPFDFPNCKKGSNFWFLAQRPSILTRSSSSVPPLSLPKQMVNITMQ